MAQKSKKSSTPWVQCDNCLTNFLIKDSDQHLENCPPDLNQINHNFVKDSVLYGTLDVKLNEDIKNLSTIDKNNLVFLSQSAIQLCGLAIGKWALVNVINSKFPPVARKVWPTIEKSLTSVLFPKNCLDLCFKQSINEFVAVSNLPNSIPNAGTVILVALNAPKSFQITKELNNRIRKMHLHNIFTTRNKISVLFYGKVLKFEIKEIVPGNESTNLEEDFENLSVDDKSIATTETFYIADEQTSWKLYKDEAEFTAENQSEQLQIAGVDEEMCEINEMLDACLNRSQATSSLLKSYKSVLLYGNSGTGKSLLANCVAQSSKATIIKICAPDLYSNYAKNPEETVKEQFANAIEHAPSVIILDEIDILCPARTSRISDTEKRIVATLLNLFDSLTSNSKVFVIATSNKPDSIDPAFRRCGRLDREIEIATPNPKARLAILRKLLEGIAVGLSEAELFEISISTHGFVGADLVSLCSRAHLSSLRYKRDVGYEDFKVAMKHVRPSAMREVQIECPNVKWSDIGGQDNLKLILKQCVEWPLKHADSFIRLGITPPRGVLMFGPPGCSKTMIAKALATESGLNFLSIKGPELFSKWVGESERAVREVFRKARQVAPSVIFFDEIDALGGERSSGSSSTSVQERVLAQLLTELDGVTPLGDVTVLAATNRPDRIDKALLRPGRLDRIVYVPLPEAQTRREIFRIKLAKMPVVNVELEDLVKATEGYSGAEVNAVCHEAAMMALEESLDVQFVEHRHFKKALELITPRTPASLVQVYDDYLKMKI